MPVRIQHYKPLFRHWVVQFAVDYVLSVGNLLQHKDVVSTFVIRLRQLSLPNKNHETKYKWSHLLRIYVFIVHSCFEGITPLSNCWRRTYDTANRPSCVRRRSCSMMLMARFASQGPGITFCRSRIARSRSKCCLCQRSCIRSSIVCVRTASTNVVSCAFLDLGVLNSSCTGSKNTG